MENSTIICTNVPAKLLNKSEAKQYFGTFGVVRKLVVKPKSQKCVVEYATIDAAEEAIMQGGEFEGVAFYMDYQTNSPTSKRKQVKKSHANTDPDWADISLQLDMAPKKTYNLRPEKMNVDLLPLSDLVQKKKTPKRERKTTKVAHTTSIGQTMEADLLIIIKQRAVTVEDKYRVLEARDKLIRLRANKTVDVRTTSSTVGTCPDMCPEKERLMREVQHQVAVYEQESGGRSMNHAIAVKQYSRSSADQEMPLPHELRNVDVLQMTMGYLMHRIIDMADSPDVNLAEWYHFLWDRTRGIRKDITQQELCCQGSVALVEQCARFHIHCSARLVAEDPSVFDQKINTENLTKCLQTLKYMYHDLAVKGERCPNEAEFRAYIILLNLNDGNFMWEVQKLDRRIQTSAAVKFALNVHSSLDDNNFVRFFKLVKSTTYLNACILLRYFVQVRMKALRTIVQCYTSRLSQAILPVNQLTELLAFEGHASTVDFVEYYGLSMNDDRTAVIFHKRHFAQPDVPYALDRAVNIIESKRTTSVGEVVFGTALPPPLFESHVPTSSFNVDGFIHMEHMRDTVDGNGPAEKAVDIFAINDQTSSPMEMDVVLPVAQQEKDEPKHGGFYYKLPEFVEHTPVIETEEEEDEKLEEERLIRQRNQLLFEIECQKQKELQEKLESQRREELEKHRQQMELQQLKRQQQMEEERREIERQRLIREDELRKQLEREAARQQQIKRDLERQRQMDLLEIARQQKEAKEHRDKLEEESKLNAIQVSVHDLMADILDRVEENRRLERLAELKAAMLSRDALRKWQRRALANKRKRKAFDQEPLWFSSVSEMAEKSQSPYQTMTLNMMKRYKRGVAAACITRNRPNITTIDLPKQIAHLLMRNSMLSKRLRNEIFWKVGIFYETNCAIVTRTLNALFEFGETSYPTFLQQVRQDQSTLTFCVEKTVLNTDVDDYNGIIVIVEQLSEKLLDDLLRFLNHLGDLHSMPMVFIVQERNEVLEAEVEVLYMNKLISERDLITTPLTQQSLVASINSAMQFLAHHFRPPPPLLLNTLRGYVCNNAGGELWQRIKSFTRWNSSYKHCVAKPQVAIALFNEAIDKLKDIAFHAQCLEHANFPAIFKDFLLNQIPDYLPCDFRYFPPFWRRSELMSLVKSCMEKLKLPEYTGKWPLDLTNQLELQHHVHTYCVQVLHTEVEKVFCRIMGKILQVQFVTWIDVVEILSGELFMRMDMSLAEPYKSETIFNQLFVVYQQPDLMAYCNDNWFYLKNAVVQAEIDRHIESQQHNTPKIVVYPSQEPTMEDFDIDAAMKELRSVDSAEEEKNLEARIQCRHDFDDFKLLLDDLEKSMTIQRKISEKFQDTLVRVLAQK